jgi:hypothetical protein
MFESLTSCFAFRCSASLKMTAVYESPRNIRNHASPGQPDDAENTNRRCNSMSSGVERLYVHGGAHRLNESRGTNMKQTTLTKILAAGGICGLIAASALAQTTTTTTTTDPVTGTTTTQQTTTSAAGNIVTYTPDSDYFMFRTTSSAAPVRYYYTKDTTVLDPEGHVVTWSAIRPDTPATVYYSTVGDRVVVRKVVLAQPAQPAAVIKREETTTTTTTRP